MKLYCLMMISPWDVLEGARFISMELAWVEHGLNTCQKGTDASHSKNESFLEFLPVLLCAKTISQIAFLFF